MEKLALGMTLIALISASIGLAIAYYNVLMDWVFTYKKQIIRASIKKHMDKKLNKNYSNTK